MEEDYRDYRYDNRDYRDGDYRDYRDYRNYRSYRDYDLRGGKINNRSYREDYMGDLEMAVSDIREQYRCLEDIAEMSKNPQEKATIMKVAQSEKENYQNLKSLLK